MDDQFLPGIAELAAGFRRARSAAARLHELLLRFADIAPGARAESARPIPRPTTPSRSRRRRSAPPASTSRRRSSPTTRQSAREFIERAWSEGGDVIYKSVSGVRSIVRRVGRAGSGAARPDPLVPDAVPAPRRGNRHPVHVVGRYRAGGERYAAMPPTIATRLARPASSPRSSRASSMPAIEREVHRARRAPATFRSPASTCGAHREGRYVCFEVNPSPGVQLLRRAHRTAHREPHCALSRRRSDALS